jgi:Putative Ig domain
MVHAGLCARVSRSRISFVLAALAATSWCMAATAANNTSAPHWDDPVHISGSPAASVTAGQEFAFQPTASDSEDRTLTFAIEHKPSWASFDTKSGELSGKPAAANVGKYADIVIAASDGRHWARLPAFAITVVAGSTPAASAAPTISGTPATTDVAGTAYSFEPTATGPSGDTLSFSVQNKPSWASFSIATGLLSGTPASTQTGTYANIVVSVSDGKASAALPAFSIVVNPPASTPQPATGSAVVNWTPPTSNTNGTPLTNLAGIRIYYGSSAANLSQSVQLAATQTTTTISNLASGTWYFAGAVFTSTGAQSSMSSVVSASVP